MLLIKLPGLVVFERIQIKIVQLSVDCVTFSGIKGIKFFVR